MIELDKMVNCILRLHITEPLIIDVVDWLPMRVRIPDHEDVVAVLERMIDFALSIRLRATYSLVWALVGQYFKL